MLSSIMRHGEFLTRPNTLPTLGRRPSLTTDDSAGQSDSSTTCATCGLHRLLASVS